MRSMGQELLNSIFVLAIAFLMIGISFSCVPVIGGDAIEDDDGIDVQISPSGDIQITGETEIEGSSDLSETGISVVPSNNEEDLSLDDWVILVIDSSYGCRENNSIAVDSNDKIHISYYDKSNWNLRYATNAGGSWSCMDIDSYGDVGDYSSIAVDSNDKIHISYYDRSNGNLKYATNSGGSWSIQTIDSYGDVGQFTSIAINSYNRPHISYYDYTNGDLKYAHFDLKGNWIIKIIDGDLNDVGAYTSIALDENNKVYISYYDNTNHHLRYATNSIDSTWDATIIDNEGDVGMYSSIAFAKYIGGVHISYYDYTNNELKYAYITDTVSIHTLDFDELHGRYSSIATDSNGKVHISFKDSHIGHFYYANNAGGSWVYQFIDYYSGKLNSIAIDSNNKAHISYVNSNSYLKYATNAFEVPTIPQNLQAEAGDCQVTLTWDAPASDGGSAISSYSIYHGTSPAPETMIKVGTTAGPSQSYVDTGLNNEQLYFFRVSAINMVGEGGMSNEAWATPTEGLMVVPSAPQNLQASPGDGQVTLTWEEPMSDGGSPIISYKIYRGTAPGLEWWTAGTDGSTLTYTDTDYGTGLINGQTYYYKVSANNSVGDGILSSVSIATPHYTGQTIDSESDVGKYSSIAVDSNDIIHISYYDELNGDLKYATNLGGSWSHYTLDSKGNVGLDSSIAIDSNDRIHISYWDKTVGRLKYATNAGVGWSYQIVDETEEYRDKYLGGKCTSIAIDSNDKVHISYSLVFYKYFDVGTDDGWTVHSYLKYATNKFFEQWYTEILRSSSTWGVPCEYSSIAIDSNDKIHISYWDPDSSYLNYLTNAGGSWYNSDFHMEPGPYTSIAIDSNDNVHISHCVGGSSLHYLTNAGGGWRVGEVVDSEGDVGLYSSIAIDSNDNIHISYYDWSNGDLKYASDAGGAWNFVTLDVEGNVGGYTSIAIDSNDKLHISYYDFNNKNLKYYAGTFSDISNIPVFIIDFIIIDEMVPSAPQNLQASAGDGQVTLTWEEPVSDGGSSILRYKIYRGESPGEEYWAATTEGSVLTYTDTGLTNGETYYYKVAANNSVGDGPPSNGALATTTAEATVPSAPQNLQATTGDGQVLLTWEEPISDGGSPIISYKIYRGTSPEEIYWAATTEESVLTYTDTGLSNGQTYYYKVLANNSIGDGPFSEVVSATPIEELETVPSAPLNLQAETGDGSVELTWDAPSSDGGSGITNYLVYRGTSSESLSLLVQLGNVLSYTDTSVENGQTYYYRVSAVNSAGEGASSEVVSATPQIAEDGGDGGGGDNTMIYVAVGAIVVVAVIAAAVSFVRRK